MAKNNQLLLDLGGEPSLTRNDLVVSPANLNAVSLIDSWPHWHGPWALLIGAKGSGKTHLSAIWREHADAFVANPQSLSNAQEAAQVGRPIVIDGLTPDALNETALFHLMNSVRTAQSHLLITAETNPDHWEIKTPDLLSRFKAATAVFINPPDDALVRAVTLKLFSDRQINVDMGVVDYLILRVERSLAAVNYVVAEIDRLALVSKSPITKPLVNQVLQSIDVGQSEMQF